MAGIWEIKHNKKVIGNYVEGIEVPDIISGLIGKCKTGDKITIYCLLEE